MAVSVFSRIILGGLVIAVLSACQGGGTPLAGNEVSTSKCPAGGCADGVPDQNQLSLSGKNNLYQTPMTSSGGTIIDRVEIGGECYASTYPDNFLTVEVSPSVGLAEGDVVDGSRVGGSKPRCTQGRFNFAIKGSKLRAGNSYTVKVTLVGIDANGDQFTNTSTGVYSVRVSR